MLQDEINNLEKALKMLQSPVKTILFLSLSHYKTIQVNKKRTGHIEITLYTNFCSRNKIQTSIICISTHLLSCTLEVSTNHSGSLLFQLLYSKLFLIT